MGHTKESLKEQLRRMGIPPDCALLVHSSMKSVGPVEGGADAVLDSLMEHLSAGLLVFPTLSYATVDSAHPEFSVLETPSCVGLLTEMFRKRPGVARSWHPTHSVAAVGKGAGAFVKGHELNRTPCAKDGPWGRLPDLKARILFIGTGISCNTFLHGVEEWNHVPDYFTKEPEKLRVETPDGRILEREYFRHDQHNSEHYAKIEALLVGRGVMKAGEAEKFGDAACHLGDCEGMERVVTELLRKDIRFFFHDRL
jgi:aminoglycoside 3-N-acetyltransferase